MQTVRRLIIVFSCLICVWVFASIAGLFFDPSRIEFWSSSLMWSLLSSLLVAPALVMAFTGPSGQTSAHQSGQHAASSNEQQNLTPESDGESSSSSRSQSSVFEQSGGAYPVSDPSDE